MQWIWNPGRSRLASRVGAGSCILLVLLISPLFAEEARPQKAGPHSWTGDLTPITTQEWSRARAAHLLERAGFGGPPQEVDHLAAMTPAAAVRHLVHYQDIDNSHVPPFDESGVFDPTLDPFPKVELTPYGLPVSTASPWGSRSNLAGVAPSSPLSIVFSIGCGPTHWKCGGPDSGGLSACW